MSRQSWEELRDEVQAALPTPEEYEAMSRRERTSLAREIVDRLRHHDEARSDPWARPLIEAVEKDALDGLAEGRRRSSRGGREKATHRKPGVHPRTGEKIPAPPDQTLAAEVAEWVGRGESVTRARKRVAEKYGISSSTLRSRTQNL